MATSKQELGEQGEVLVASKCKCPRCNRTHSLKRLPANFKCADLICDFCGFLGQVKTSRKSDINKMPKTLLGAAWSSQKERMDAGFYFPFFMVLISPMKKYSIYYLAAEFQKPDLFIPRKPFSITARRAGWQGFYYELNESVVKAFVKLI